MKQYFVYILASQRNGTLYVGVTNDLVRRTFEHRDEELEGFTQRYGVGMLVYYEFYDEVHLALQREKNIKHWSRKWKLNLIEGFNPTWRDLYDEIAS